MRVIFRARSHFLAELRRDLARPHRFAAERVGFISVRAANTPAALVLLADQYHLVADDDYVDDPTVGAMMGQEAIRKALDVALLHPVGMFHVHMHDHAGRPAFSCTDLREQEKFVPDFFKVRPGMPHGAIVLSYDRATGRIWFDRRTITFISEFNSVGSPLTVDLERSPDSAETRK